MCGEPSLGIEPSPHPYQRCAQPLSYKGVGLAGTTRTCCLRLRRAALCPDELRRDDMPLGRRQVRLPSVDARGRTWNTRLRRPVLCPLSYVDRVQRGSGAVRTPEAHGPTRVQAGLLNHPDRFLRPAAGVTAEGVGLEPTQRPGRPNGVANRPLDQLGYPSKGGAVMTTTRREWDSNPRTGAARLPSFQGGPFSSLGISPSLVVLPGWRRAGESNSQAGWSPAVRFRSGWAHHMPRPSRTVHALLRPRPGSNWRSSP